MGRYPDRVIQKRFGQRSSGVGIVWEKPKDVDVDHYELFISSREADSTQVEIFCRGEVDFARKYSFDSSVQSVVDNMTPMFRRMLYSVFAVDKAGNYVNVPFSVDDSKNMNLKSPKYIAVEEGPWGIKGSKPIEVEEGPVGVKGTKPIAVEEGPVGTAKGVKPVAVEKGSIGVEEGPVGIEMAAAKPSQMAAKTQVYLLPLILYFDGKEYHLGNKDGKVMEIKALSYKVIGEEKKVMGEIVASKPIGLLEESYHLEAHPPCTIEISTRELTEECKLMGYAGGIITVVDVNHILQECKVSSIEVSYDGGSLRLSYAFTAKGWDVDYSFQYVSP